MKNDFVKPILVLSLICLVISGALAFTNSVTDPVILLASAEREDNARYEMIPEAEGFERIEIDGLPATVSEVYKATNDVGYIFMISTSGYGGEIRMICAIDSGGILLRNKTLDHTETKGLGARVADAPFADRFNGKDSALEGVAAISGATISSTAYINAIKDAFAAFERIRSMG